MKVLVALMFGLAVGFMSLGTVSACPNSAKNKTVSKADKTKTTCAKCSGKDPKAACTCTKDSCAKCGGKDKKAPCSCKKKKKQAQADNQPITVAKAPSTQPAPNTCAKCSGKDKKAKCTCKKKKTKKS